jgi:hypothetical protein
MPIKYPHVNRIIEEDMKRTQGFSPRLPDDYDLMAQDMAGAGLTPAMCFAGYGLMLYGIIRISGHIAHEFILRGLFKEATARFEQVCDAYERLELTPKGK